MMIYCIFHQPHLENSYCPMLAITWRPGLWMQPFLVTSSRDLSCVKALEFGLQDWRCGDTVISWSIGSLGVWSLGIVGIVFRFWKQGLVGSLAECFGDINWQVMEIDTIGEGGWCLDQKSDRMWHIGLGCTLSNKHSGWHQALGHTLKRRKQRC